MAFTAFSGGQVLDMLRSAALLSPIAHMRDVNSPIARIFADTFLAEVRHKQHHFNFNSFIDYNLSLIILLFSLCDRILTLWASMNSSQTGNIKHTSTLKF